MAAQPVFAGSSTSGSRSATALSVGMSQHKWSGGPFMLSYLVQLDHLCIDINGSGKTYVSGPTYVDHL